MRVGEVNAQAGERGQLLVPRHLLALVAGQGEAQRCRHREQTGGEAITCRLGLGIGQLDQDHLATDALDQRADRGTVAGSLDQVALPMPGHQAARDLRWPLADARHVADPAAAFAVLGPPAAVRLALAQAGEQLPAQFTARYRVDRLMDRFMRNPQPGRHRRPLLQALAPSRDLLRRPLPAQQLRHLGKQRAVRRELGPASRPVPPRCRRGLRRPGGVAAVRVAAAPDLRADHARRTAKLTGDRPHAPAVLAPQIDRNLVFHCQLPSLPLHPPLLLPEQRWCSLRNLNPPIDIKHLPKLQTADGERRKRYLYVAIDRASRRVHLAVKDEETEICASAFLNEAVAAFPFRVTHVLTDRGSCFTADGFEKACRTLGIEHRTTKPYTPKTNGMVERFNGRVGREVLTLTIATHRDLECLLRGYNVAYNARRQRVLEGRSPDEVVRDRLRARPELASRLYQPPADPCILPKAMLVVECAKNVSHPDN